LAQIHVTDAQTDDILDSISDNFWDDVWVQKLEDSTETFDFKTLPEVSASQFLRERNRLVIPDKDGAYREFIIDEHIQELDFVEVFSTASYLELAKYKPITPGIYAGHTPKTALELILDGTGWTPGRAEYAATTDLEFTDYVSPLAALKMAAALLGRELVFRVETNGYKVTGRYVDMVAHHGDWRGREIVSGRDLINAKRRETTENVVTALIGLGPNVSGRSQIVVEVSDADARQRWGRSNQHLWSVYKPEFNKAAEEVTNEDVREATQTELARRINAVVQYEITSADLESIFGSSHDKVRLGDNVRIKATEYDPPLYMDARVISIESSIRNQGEKKFVLGEFIEYSASEIESLREEFRKQFEETRGIHYGPTPPADKSMLWIDTTYEPYRVMVYSYDESLWKRATPINPIDVGAEIETHRGVNPPSDTRKLWIDTSQEPNVMKQYDEVTERWIKITPTEAEEVGAETPGGAQDKADQAEENASNKSEADKYRGHIETLERADAEYGRVYTKLKANPYLTDSTALDDAKSAYNVAYDNVVATMSLAVADDVIGEAERDDITTNFTLYTQAVADLEEAFEAAREQIADFKVREVEEGGKDYTDLTDELVRTDLRLDAPLPTSITMDDNGITATTEDGTGYARMDYRGLYVHNGALMIEGGLDESSLASDILTKLTQGSEAKSTLDEKVEIWDSKANGTYIDNEGVYSGNIVGNQIVGGTISGVTFNTFGSSYGTVTIDGGRLVSDSSGSSTQAVFANGYMYIHGSDGTNVELLSDNIELSNDVQDMFLNISVSSSRTVPEISSTNYYGTRRGLDIRADVDFIGNVDFTSANISGIDSFSDDLYFYGTSTFSDYAYFNYDVKLRYGSELLTSSSEHGYTGVSSLLSSSVAGVCAGSWQSFRIKKDYSPSSVSLSSTSSNISYAGLNTTQINQYGFWVYFENQTSGFRYWRGTYDA
jgi:phage minor structural protein